ncbi:MAG TPA: isoleucine--tRNA ligase [Candidatus Latescibacteria bacterium]|nr:isoleucine--tRNA ligase [Candidatus Latescibacterota bacterium]
MYRDVPPTFSLPELERRILAFWKEHDTFNKLRRKNENGPRWSFIDGPITANNLMGVHHAWGRTYKDAYQRYHSMLGQHLRYQNGFDCQGLWVEVEVEKELGFKSKRDIEEYGIDRFVEACKARVIKFSKRQAEQSIRLGYWMDWDNSYYTMSDENNYTIWHFLKKCHDRGFIYAGHDVMPWCPRCGTAISDQEIVTEGYQELTHTSVTAKFPLVGRPGESLLVWTTTPWTLTANVAAAVHPDLTYLAVKQGDETFYLAKACAERTLKNEYAVLRELPGSELLGWAYSGPFDELPPVAGVEHRVIAWDEVTEEEGTGIVHIAPGCGKEDFALGKQFDLAVIAPIDENGLFAEDFGPFTGKHASHVPEDVFASLKDKGRLYRTQKYSHRYPVCWRCKTELLFRLVDEWFIDMSTLRYEIMEVTKRITWMPSYGLDHELDWLKNMGDWCISKKRFWGLALPIYPCQKCGNVDVIGSETELEQRAVEGWEKFAGHSPHRPWVDAVKIGCSKCGSPVSRIKDVGNPWLDAGIVPYSTLNYRHDREYWNNWFPAEFITESLQGQFRNWFYSLLAMSTVMENREPFKRVLGHAQVRDLKGEEMHKSKGNAIWFDDAAEKMGAETMRWLYCRQNPYTNLNFGYEAAEEPLRHLTTLWNTYKFFVTYAKIDGFVPGSSPVPYDRLDRMDRWILARLNQLIADARRAFDGFSVMNFVHAAERFIDDLSNWYVRRCRDRFRQADQAGDPAAYETLYTVLSTTVRLLAPVIPMFAEELYQNLVAWREGEPESVHLTQYPEETPEWEDAALVADMALVRNVVEIALAARNAAKIKVRQPLAVMTVVTDPSAIKTLEANRQVIAEELNVKRIVFTDSAEGLTTRVAKPVFRALGPRFGKDANAVGNILRALDQDTLARIAAGETVTIPVNGKHEQISSELVEVVTASPQGMSVVSDKQVTVALDTNLSDDLVDEGFAREIVNKIQNMRKEADFNVSDRITVGYSVSPRLARAIDSCRTYIMKETLARELVPLEGEWEHRSEWSVNGEPAELGVRRTTQSGLANGGGMQDGRT